MGGSSSDSVGCQCTSQLKDLHSQLSTTNQDVTANAASIRTLSSQLSGGISTVVVNAINTKDSAIQKAIVDTVYKLNSDYVLNSDLNNLIKKTDQGNILIGSDGDKPLMPVTMGSITSSGNMIGNSLVATQKASWDTCDSLLKTYTNGRVYMGGGEPVNPACDSIKDQDSCTNNLECLWSLARYIPVTADCHTDDCTIENQSCKNNSGNEYCCTAKDGGSLVWQPGLCPDGKCIGNSGRCSG